jgi:hypothetical protein
MATENLNLGMFSRVAFVRDDGTLTREAQAAMAVVQRRTGDIAGVVYADEIANVPAGGIVATDVQAAIDELENEKATVVSLNDHIADATDAHAASAITNTPAGGIAATTVQSALNELDTEKLSITSAGTMAFQNANNVAITGGSVTTGTGAIGYSAGNGGTVTQTTDKGTGVVLNELSGEITMDAAALGAGAIVSFPVTNSTVAATDVVICNHVTAGTIGAYTVTGECSSSAVDIYVRNNTAGVLSEPIVIRFAVFKAATS